MRSTANPIKKNFTEREGTMNNPGIEPRLLKEADAAKWLGIGRRKLWSLQASGALPVVRIGRSVRYDKQDLELFVERLKIEKGGTDG
ncbi:DNA binding domain-containing protein, excisionase family [Neorhodopirellula lusitana]|uniref:DNA binding domain-containing protein, excisionase family n=1 Tax=Neorhodopirellula lusitana TaxID=445327 RepID=A0ABY1QE95_9BACT|nr:helix-turn-helix domain-containing protein [Neorhodopirellula lusitana]SMP65568.1 DNA binding domain-containing protein, excisionase family [Neorhodopirellula lusitana]